jgi:membrane-associated phospholipid phosphatase
MSIWKLVSDASRATLDGTKKQGDQWYVVGHPNDSELAPGESPRHARPKGTSRRTALAQQSRDGDPVLSSELQYSQQPLAISNDLTLSTALANFARVISDVSSPPAIAILALAIGGWASHSPGIYRYALAYFCIAVLLPVVYVVWAIRAGRIGDFHLSNRRERVAPFVVSLVCGLSAWIVLIATGAPRGFAAFVLAMLFQTLLLFLITLVWQVSVHTAGAAGLVTFVCLVVGPAAMLLIGVVPLVAWSRLYLGRHTLAQAVVGALVGSSCFTILFALHGIAW